MSEATTGGHAGGTMSMEVEGAGEGQEEVESSLDTVQEAAERSSGADGECVSDGMHLIIPEDYPDEMTMIARGAGYECFASGESITVVGSSTAAIVFEATAESTVLAGRLAVGEDGDGHLVLKIAPRERSRKCTFTASSISKGEFGALRDATEEEAGGGEEEWAAPATPPSCVGLGEPVEFAQGGILRKGSRVCVATKDGDELEGTVVMYNFTTGTYNVRLDTGELERDIARSSISKVTLEAGQILRCWFAGCRGRLADGHQQEKGHSTRSVSITDKTRAGNRDWARMRGWTLCFTCYVRFIQHGTLILGRASQESRVTDADGGGKRAADDPLTGREEKKQVKLPPTFTAGESCANCQSTHGRCRRVASSARAGNRDWSAYYDKCLCNACYVKYATTGTMRRPGTSEIANPRGGGQDRTDSNRASGTLPSPPAATRRKRASKSEKASEAIDDEDAGSWASAKGGPEQPSVGSDAREDKGISEAQQSQQTTEVEKAADEERRWQEQQQQQQSMQQQQHQEDVQQQQQQLQVQQRLMQHQQDVQQQQQQFLQQLQLQQQLHNQQLLHQQQVMQVANLQHLQLQQQQQQPVDNDTQKQGHGREVDERLITVQVPVGAVAGGTFLVDFLGKRFSVPVSNTMFVGQAVTIKVDMNAVA